MSCSKLFVLRNSFELKEPLKIPPVQFPILHLHNNGILMHPPPPGTLSHSGFCKEPQCAKSKPSVQAETEGEYQALSYFMSFISLW